MRRIALFVGSAAVLLGGCFDAPPVADPPPIIPLATTTVVDPSTTTTSTTIPAAEGWYVVSITAELPEDFSAGLAELDGVDAVSVVRVENLELVQSRDADGTVVDEAPNGFYIPVETHAIDPAAHAEYVPEEVASLLAGLGPNDAVLSESSAAFRRLDEGSELLLQDGTTLSVAGVVADEWIGAAEIVLSMESGAARGIERERYALVHSDGSPSELEQQVSTLTEEPVRVQRREEVDVFRHADAVASQIAIKAEFGEFALQPTQGDFIEIDPAWLEANIVEVEIPLLGNDKCHRKFVAILFEVVRELERSGQADAIDSSGYLGCWNSRFIRGRKDVSRHAWGAAADINFGNEPDGGPGSPTNPALLEAMLAREVLSGHAWSDPDPGHFEWFGDAP